jgi:hypothetical protein
MMGIVLNKTKRENRMTEIKGIWIAKIIPRCQTSRYMLLAPQRVEVPRREAQLPPIQAHPL